MNITTHDEYIAQVPEHLQPALVTLRDQLRKILPNAEEVVEYNMPGFSENSATIVGYAAFSKQCGVYVSTDAISALSEELTAAGFAPTKMGVKFTPDKPIPEPLLKKLMLASRKSYGL